MTDDLSDLNHPPEWAKPIRVQATLTLPGLSYGDVVIVDRSDPTIQEYLREGFLIRVGDAS